MTRTLTIKIRGTEISFTLAGLSGIEFFEKCAASCDTYHVGFDHKVSLLLYHKSFLSGFSVKVQLHRVSSYY